METSDTTRFYWFDSTLYRDSDSTVPNEMWTGKRWKAVVPSKQDYNGMREVTADEAERLIAA